MNPRALGATAARILRQLAHDPRSIAMMLVLPIVLMTLLYYMFDARQPMVSHLLLVMLGLFPFIVMFLITSVAMLRERTSGTLERLMTTPVGKADLLFGYGIAFGVAAAVQGTVAAAFAYGVLGVDTPGAAWLTILVAVGGGALGVSMGLVASAFARTEFQAVQMFPVVVIPQSLLCGLFVARGDMADWLRLLSNVMPLSYVVEALQEVGAHTGVTAVWWRDVGVIAGCVLLALGLAAATLRRRTD